MLEFQATIGESSLRDRVEDTFLESSGEVSAREWYDKSIHLPRTRQQKA